jgi:hypothetical protein
MLSAHVVLIAVMIAAGLAGGFGNMLGGPQHEDLPPWRRYAAPFVLGLVAAFATPLFLNLAESQLVENLIREHPRYGADIFVFAGFCLVAALSSRMFLGRLTQQLIALKQDVEKVRTKAEETAEEQDAINATIIETLKAVPSAVELAGVDVPGPGVASPAAWEVLKTLRAGPTVWRSISGVRKEANLDRDAAHRLLEELVAAGLADTKVAPSSGNRLYRAMQPGSEAA